MPVLNLLGVPFAQAVYIRVQMPCVRALMIGIKAGEAVEHQQHSELQKDLAISGSQSYRLRRLPYDD